MPPHPALRATLSRKGRGHEFEPWEGHEFEPFLPSPLAGEGSGV